jgi:hypothetical protein
MKRSANGADQYGSDKQAAAEHRDELKQSVRVWRHHFPEYRRMLLIDGVYLQGMRDIKETLRDISSHISPARSTHER